MSKSNKLIITAALTGAGTSKSTVPALPVTAEEIAADAIRCAKAGASIIHIHVRDETGNCTMETRYFTEAFRAIKAACIKEQQDLIINLTTSNGPGTDELRLAHLEELRPEMCSFDAGTMNWGNNTIFENSPQFLEKLGSQTRKLNIKPEVELFDASMIGNMNYYIKNGFLFPPIHVQFVLGVPGGLDGTIDSLNFMLPKIPLETTWSITGIGKTHMSMMLAGLAAGADGLRVGLEDNVMMAKGVQASNVKLVERAVTLAKIAGREIATPEEARKILGITRK